MLNPEKEVLEQLKKISKLLAHLLVKGEIQGKAISTLTHAGLQPVEIAEILGTTSGSVRVALVGLRKKGKVHKASPKKKSN